MLPQPGPVSEPLLLSEVLPQPGLVQALEPVQVPDFAGMNRQQAADAAGNLGLYLLIAGNDDPDPAVTVLEQSIPAGETVPRGTTVKLTFADTRASD